MPLRYGRIALAAVLVGTALLLGLSQGTTLQRLDHLYLSSGDEVRSHSGYHGEVIGFCSGTVTVRLPGGDSVELQREDVFEP
jgi:preprotein translocase subunit YajC